MGSRSTFFSTPFSTANILDRTSSFANRALFSGEEIRMNDDEILSKKWKAVDETTIIVDVPVSSDAECDYECIVAWVLPAACDHLVKLHNESLKKEETDGTDNDKART